MKCEQMAELLPDYLEGRLSPNRHHEVAAHLAECANCSAQPGVSCAFRSHVASVSSWSLQPARGPAEMERFRVWRECLPLASFAPGGRGLERRASRLWCFRRVS